VVQVGRHVLSTARSDSVLGIGRAGDYPARQNMAYLSREEKNVVDCNNAVFLFDPRSLFTETF
jgi:hypothetical protein